MRTLSLLLLIGCGGGGTSGEPIMGSVSLDYGGENPKMVVGTAVQDEDVATKMLVQIGSNNVDCDTYVDRFLDFDVPKGSFIYFTADKTATGMISGSVSVMKSTSNSVTINSGPGTFTLDSTAERVTGSVAFTTTDEDVGNIVVAGTFDVKRCF